MMLKKSLLAISLAAAVGIANAGTLQPEGVNGTSAATPVKTAPQTVSKQAAVTNVSGVGFKVLVAKTDTIRQTFKNATGVKITITGATLTPASEPALGGVFTATKAAAKYDGNTALTFKVTPGLNFATPADTATLNISGLALAVDGTSPVSVVVEVLSPIEGSNIDSASGTLLSFVDEFAISAVKGAVVPFNGVIDFDRTDFSTGGDTALTGKVAGDTATVAYSTAKIDHPASGGVTGVATKGAVRGTATLNGDFSFLDTNANGTVASTEGSVTGTLAKDLQSSTVAMTSASQDFVVRTSGQTIPAQAYTADIKIDYTNSAGKAGSVSLSTKLGSWTLNGQTTNLQFMPFGSQYANSITVTNTSKIAGAIKVSMVGNGKTVAATVVGTAAAQSVTQVGPAVAALAAANGITEGYVSVTTNAPVDKTSVVGIYYSKADGDRVLTR